MKTKYIILGSLAAVLVAYFSLIMYNPTTAVAYTNAEVYQIKSVKPAAGDFSPDFTWMEDGKVVSFKDYTKGKVVFLNFWGTWCPPCRREIPDIIKLNKDLKKDDFVVVGIALERNPNTAVQQVGNFMKAKGINYKNFVNADDLVRAFNGIQAVPTTYIIGKDGKISDKIVGGRNYNQFMEYIKKAMNPS